MITNPRKERLGSNLVRRQAIKVNGIKDVDGMKFHDIEGGFGEGKKSLLVKEIANIHNKEFKHINEAINNNIERFKKGIDIVDLKGTEFAVDLVDSEIFTQNSINASKNIYLLSERGYAKLLKILEDDVAWDQYEKLVDGYFNMREKIKEEPKSAFDILELQFQALKEVKDEVREVKEDFSNLPLLTVDSKELQRVVNRIVVQLLGGKKAPAYKPLSRKVFSDLYKQLWREFGVDNCAAIKRKDLEAAKEIVTDYKLPRALDNEIEAANNQMSFEGDD